MSIQRFEEFLTEGYYYGVEAELIEAISSRYQHIEILKHEYLGKMLRIDGALQCSEGDEFAYHEPLVHMVMARTQPRARVLIIGGGDGGAAEEALKWPQLARLDQVELDAEVVDLACKHLRSIHHGLLEPGQTVDARFHLQIGDGFKYIKQQHRQGNQLDALILDLTDPGGPSLPLWNADFFALCAQVLGGSGVLGLHVGAPWAQQQRCQQVLDALRVSFPEVTPFITHIPVSGGPWLMAVAAARHALCMPSREMFYEKLQSLRPPRLKMVDGRVLHGMVDIAHHWNPST